MRKIYGFDTKKGLGFDAVLGYGFTAGGGSKIAWTMLKCDAVLQCDEVLQCGTKIVI